jgi:branched-chain amino acid transport system permease protein
VREKLASFFRSDPGSGKRADGATVFWIIASTSATLLLMGWLLPWFVNDYSAGAGYSPQDALVSPPTGIGTFLIYILAVPMLVLVLSPIVEAVVRSRGRTLWRRADRVRLILALAGLALTALVWFLVSIVQEEPLFGSFTSGTYTDSAVWLTMYGYALAALAYGARRWVIGRQTLAFGVAVLPFGIFLPLMFHQAPVFLLWAAGSLAIYMLLALGLNVVVGFAGLLDLGYAAFFAIGAYACASFASPAHNIHLPLWVLIFLGAAIASIFGAVLGAPTLRLRGDYLAIVTLGFGEIIPDLATNNVFNLTGGANGISGIDQPHFGPFNFSLSPRWYYWSLLIVVIAVIVLLKNIERSRVGRAWVALREDEVAAAATGINTTTTKLLAFAIGASVSGFAGAFYGSLVTIVSPDDFSFSVSIAVLSIIVLGGIGNITGVILGSFILTFVIFWVLPNMNEWSATLSQTVHVPAIANINLTNYTYIIYGIALILMMLLRPGGLLPSRARRIELESAVEGESLAAVQGVA